ncbi:MAG TPA: penicillin-insensitive murein endopeptidase [Azospirillum sp.]|nr:penicillin-insensitive murein endopeptidase [Azospirillum sp.]
MAKLLFASTAAFIAAACLSASVGAAETKTIPATFTPPSLMVPSPGAAQPIGSYANGCIQGAGELPPEGPGYQVVNLSRHRNFGHPVLLDYITGLARRVRSESLGRLAVGDLSQPRGGRMELAHASHQIGLDADVWFDLDLPSLPRSQRERTDLPSMVSGTTQRVDPSRFGPRQRRLLRLAASDERVTRIFVNPAIKLALCEGETGDRTWLRKIRPWFGHAAHFHVRLECPAGSTSCVPQSPIPPGDGCNAELLSWFEPKAPPREHAKPSAPPPPPPACVALFAK